MPEPHTPSDIAIRPVIPLGITPHDVAREFASDMSDLDAKSFPVIPVVEIDLMWPFVQSVRDNMGQPLVLVERGLLHIVATLANIAGRLTDSQNTAQVAAAKRDLHAMRFETLPGEPAMTEREARFARAFGQGILRFLVADACMSSYFGTPEDSDAASIRTLDDGRQVRPVRSVWLRRPEFMGMLSTFVAHKANEDAYSPFASGARAGVSLFLLTTAVWEYQTLENPNILSVERYEETCCIQALERWRVANTSPDGNERSGYPWAMWVSEL